MISALLICLGLVGGVFAFGRPRSVNDIGNPQNPDIEIHDPETGGASELGPVTIVIPARDEQASIGALLSDLATARPVGSRVIVVNDHSTDDTAEIASAFDFVELIDAPELPARWCGKSWACHTGSLSATDGVILFLDADVRVTKISLARMIVETIRTDGLVSVQPFHEVQGATERLSALFNVIAIMGSGVGRRHLSGAFGPAMSTSAANYRHVGGHSAVRGAIVEDLALFKRYRNAGISTTVVVGSDDLRFRMYPLGLPQLVEGWTKNFATGAGSTSIGWLALIVAWVAALGSISLRLGSIALGESTPHQLITIGLYLVAVAQLNVLFRRVGRFGIGSALAFPVLTAFFMLIFVRSLYFTLVRRSVPWRGREIPSGPGSRPVEAIGAP